MEEYKKMQHPQARSSSTPNAKVTLPTMVTDNDISVANATISGGGGDSYGDGRKISSSNPNNATDDQSCKIFTLLRDYDVLLGRGNGVNNRTGNMNFRRLVEAHRESYTRARRQDKATIGEQVVNMVRSKGGRFLKLLNIGTGADVSNSNPTLTGIGRYARETYQEISHARAIEKACQALREGCSGRKQQRAFVKAALALKSGNGRLRRGLGRKAATACGNTNTKAIEANHGVIIAIAPKNNCVYRQMSLRPDHPANHSSGVGFGASSTDENIPTKSSFGTGAAAYATFAAAAAASKRTIHISKPAFDRNQINEGEIYPTSHRNDVPIVNHNKIHDENHIHQIIYNDLRRREFLESKDMLSKTESTPEDLLVSAPTCSALRLVSKQAAITPSPWTNSASTSASASKSTSTSEMAPSSESDFSSPSSSSHLAQMLSSDLYCRPSTNKKTQDRSPNGVEIIKNDCIIGYGNQVMKNHNENSSSEMETTLSKTRENKHPPLQSQSQLEMYVKENRKPLRSSIVAEVGKPQPIVSSTVLFDESRTYEGLYAYCCTPSWYDDEEWNDLYQQLMDFSKIFGHCAVPPLYDKNEELADWACYQRQIYRETIEKGYRPATKLEKTRIDRLQRVQFVWDYDDWHWKHQHHELRILQHQRQQGQNEQHHSQERDQLQIKQQNGSSSFGEFEKCLNLALWLKEQRELYIDGIRGKGNIIVAEERLQKLKTVFSVASGSNGVPTVCKTANAASASST